MRTVSFAVLAVAVVCSCSKASNSGTPAASSSPVASSTPTTPSASHDGHEGVEEIIASTPSAESGPPLDTSPAAMAKVLAGIAQFQRLCQQRLALGREPNEACMAKLDARGTRIEQIAKTMGGQERLQARRTRYACCAPYLDETIDGPTTECLMSCTEDDTPHNGSDEDDWGGRGGVREHCQHALVALSDWAADIRAGKP